MSLTVVPNEDGTLDVTNGGEWVTMTPEDVQGNTSFSKSEKAFLMGQFVNANPDGGSCRVRPPAG